MNNTLQTSLAMLVLALATTAAQADQAKDDAMLALATKSGCMTCHHVDPGA